MAIKGKLNAWLAAAVTLFGRNWITLFGTVVTTVSGLLIAAFLILGFLGMTNSPYIGIMVFMILPVAFVGGLLIIPVGAFWERRRLAKLGPGASEEDRKPFPTIDLNNPATLRATGLVLILTFFNVLIVSTVSYKGVVYMESVEFCGQVCHSVMEPEHTAYLDSPHSRVECVACHIGPGAPWFVRSKLSGLRQVLAVALNTYQRPIPTPVENLRPSRETCEQCHWPEKFAGDRVKVMDRYAEDEENTPSKTVLLMHVGGGASHGTGIHNWHIDPSIRTTYVAADKERQHIVKVRVEKEGSPTVEFADPEFDFEEAVELEERVMDCIDCHNRPTHIYRMPGPALDKALSEGRIDRSLPFIKKVGVEALTAAVGEAEDLEAIAQKVVDFYREEHPEVYESKRDLVDGAIAGLQAIYSRNVFPRMGVTWGTYPSNIGHSDEVLGCFRCHDEVLTNSEGDTIGQDCSVCHAVLAWDEEDPEILNQLEIQ